MSALRAYVIDPLERALWTFVQHFGVAMLAAGGGATLITHQPWEFAVDTAGFAAVASLITSVLTFKVPKLSPVADLAVRVFKTGLQSFSGTVAASHMLSISGTDWRGALGLSVPVMLTALLKGLAALGIPTTDGASTLPDENLDLEPDDEDEPAPQGGVANAGLVRHSPQPTPSPTPSPQPYQPEHLRPTDGSS